MHNDSSSRQIAPWIRVFSTVFLLVLAYLAGSILLPGVDREQFARMLASTKQSLRFNSTLSIVALGLTPLVNGFFLVELFAFLVPAWRPLRADGFAGRRKLTRAALLVSMLLALVQGYFIARWLDGSSGHAPPGLDVLVENRPPGWTLLIALTLAGGTAALWAVAGLIERIGIGSGVGLLLGSGMIVGALGDAAKRNLPLSATPVELASMAAITAGVAVATWVLLRGTGPDGRSGAVRHAAIQQPITTLLPMQSAASLLALPFSLAGLGWISSEAVTTLTPGQPTYYVAYFVLLVGLSLVCGWGFSKPSPNIDPHPRHRRRAILISGSYLLGLWGVSLLPSLLELPSLPDPLHVVLLTAIALDVLDEWRARRVHKTLSAVWRASSVEAAISACIELQRAGIFALPRSFYLRSLWRFFAPLYAVDILVPDADVERARLLLSGESPAVNTPLAAAGPSITKPLSRRSIFIASGLILTLLALCVTSILIARHQKLRSVLRIVLGPAQAGGAEVSAALAQDVQVVRSRLEKLGLSSARAQVKSARLIIELPQIEPGMLERVRTTLLRSGRLEFLSADTTSEAMTNVAQFVVAHESAFPDVKIGYDAWYGANGGAQTDRYLEARTQAAIEQLLAALPAELGLPADHVIRFEKIDHLDDSNRPDGERRIRSHYLVREPVLTGKSLKDVELAFDQTGRPEVALTLNSEGATRFADYTASHIGKRLAIVLEGNVMSVPTIQGRIAGGRLRITLGNASTQQQTQEARDLVEVLRVGELPLPLRIEREEPIE